jgi:hypothetical protein
MILPNVIIPKLVHKRFEFYSPDSEPDCQSRKHFNHYPYNITYEFNSRGFRDNEWPTDLENAIWCLGDSTTVGIGAPITHSWPFQLSKTTDIATINLGIRAIDNYTISEIAREIILNIRPKNILILWSFFERRPVGNIQTEIVDLSEQLIVDNDLDHYDYFTKCILNLQVPDSKTNIVHGFLPNSDNVEQTLQSMWNNVKDPNWPAKIESIDAIDHNILEELDIVHNVYNQFKKIFEWCEFKNKFMKNRINNFEQLDLARDGHHWDIEPSKLRATEFKNFLKI